VICILLIGFNRPDLIEARLEEVLKYSPGHIPIRLSIDGPRKGNYEDSVSQKKILRISEKYRKAFDERMITEVQANNLGCDNHIYQAITKAMVQFEAVICLEDDIQIGPQTVQAFIDKYMASSAHVICGMSTFKSNGRFNKILLTNKWREGKYFSAWGYLISREFWNNFAITTHINAIEYKLEPSKYWKKLSKNKKITWLGRFQRGNIDYQIQLEAFSKNISIILPIFRIIDNSGLGDPRATHTYHKRPKSMFGQGPSTIFPSPNSNLRNAFLTSFLNTVDSNTWAGDGVLSVRGRRTGIRTASRRLIKIASKSRGQQN
jgi:hypothetical protein